jgi:hypothetical protein
MGDSPEGKTGRHRARHALPAASVLAFAMAVAVSLIAVGPIDDVSAATSRVAAQAVEVGPAVEGKPPLDEPAVPVRIRVPNLGIDLPVVSSERTLPGNVRGYPLCDVAHYWTRYDLPGAPGTTWIYAHAQPGMFLPLLLTANATAGRGLIGQKVTLQLRDRRLLTYRITEVKQHAVDRRIASRSQPGEQRLILQTSEGPPGTIPKLQVAARLVDAAWTDSRAPKPQPRVCSHPRTGRADGGKPGGPKASAPPAVTANGEVDSAPLALGGGAVLLGAVLLAIYLVRRPAPDRTRRP